MPSLTLLPEGRAVNAVAYVTTRRLDPEWGKRKQTTKKTCIIAIPGGNGRSRYLFHPPKHRRCEGLQQSGRPAERILRSTGRHDGRQSLLQTAHTSRDPGRQFDSLPLNPDVQWNIAITEKTHNQIRDEMLWKCSNMYIKKKRPEEGRGLTLSRQLEIAENCEKVDTQLAAVSRQRKGENPAVIRRIKETRRGSSMKNQSRDPGFEQYRQHSVQRRLKMKNS